MRLTSWRSPGRLLAAAIAFVIAARIVLWAVPVSADWHRASLGALLVFSSGIVGAASWWAAGRPGNEATRRAFRFLGAGLLATFAGGVMINFDALLDLDDSPVAWAAYSLFLTSAVLQAAGVLSWPRRATSERGGVLFNGILFCAIGLFVLVKLVVLPLITVGATEAEWLLVGSAISDLALFAIVAGGLVVGGWRERGRLTVLAGALIVEVIAASSFALAGGETAGRLAELGWAISTALLAAAVLLRPGWSLEVGFEVPELVGALLLGAGLATLAALELAEEWPRLGGVKGAEEVALAGLFALVVLRYWRVAQDRQREARETRQLAAELEAAYSTRDAALEASHTGLRAFSRDGVVVFENSAWHGLLGAEADLHERHVPNADHFRSVEGRLLRVRSTELTTGDTLVSVEDLTAEERERSTRDRFLAEVVGAQELERRRIAELLHDDAVQRMTALGLRIELASMRSGDSSLLELSAEAGRIVAEIRRLLVELHPAVLESQGLAAAAEAAGEALRSLGVRVVVDPFMERLPPELEQLAYRLVQEALANTLKHAGASRVHVSLDADEDVLRVEVADDGCGCDPASATSAVSRGAFGLHLVRERIELAGGEFSFDSQLGTGTTFRFELPLTRVSRDAVPLMAEAAA